MSYVTRGGRLLLVEDDPQLAAMLEQLLTEEGYVVSIGRDGQDGLHQGLVQEFDVMVIDRGLPGIEGVDLVTRLRARGVGAPILLLTARNSVVDRVEGLDAGAQDYLGKPFDVEELLARLRALLRPLSSLAEELPLGRGRLVVGENRVTGATDSGDSGDDADITLSRRETELLAMMARRPKRVFTREELLGSIFEGAETPGAVDTYVHYLRRKLGAGVVDTVHGVGYRLGSS
ncbi:MAG TPA: response regulator transcription factor [Pedococcus sp.]|jgi:DNA-binding response OmpR family regulator|nr:response regulator transcription factor [Pedococcus sp.]